jgi:hypothetical protein
MAREGRRTFREILRGEGPRIARELENKARAASRLAKIHPVNASTLYSLKNRAIRQLFRIPGERPFIRDAWTTRQGILLSIRLSRTGSFLHFPFEELHAPTQEFYRAWIAKRACGRRFEPATSAARSAGRRVKTRIAGEVR